uniref:Uncharacterized protein n=1 Tax=Avena sativa TaxID=4498 RepID=A0ACD5UXS8_AVESA
MTSSASSSALSDALASGPLSTAVVQAASPASLVVGVIVKAHVPVVLNLQASNYSKWRMLIGVLLGKYELSGHVNADTPTAARTAEWSRLYFVVRSWLYGSVSDDILNTIMSPDQTAFQAYALIRGLFLDNQLTRAVYLEAEFRAIAQGNLTISAYCRRLKYLSDALRDVGQPVSDQTLVLTCLRGLNPRYSDIITLITMQVPAPTFLQTRSLLLLRENQLAHPAPGVPSPASSQIAHYGNTSGSEPSFGGNTGGGTSSRGGGGNRRWQKKKNGGVGVVPGNAPSSAPGPWICFNPATGQAHQMQPTWRPAGVPPPSSGGPGVLGPRPTAPTQRYTGPSTWVPPGQQAYTTQLAPLHGQAFGTSAPSPGRTYGAAPGAPAWDCSALVAALNNTVASTSTGSPMPGPWVMDSGATSHMVNDPGSSHPARDHTMQ